MAAVFSPVQKQAWSILAQTWVDTEYDDQDRAKFARDLVSTGFSTSELRRIAYWEVCGSFAHFSVVAFATAGMALPDWCYPEELAQEEIASWLSRPIVFSLFNPVWLVGYLLSVTLMRATMGRVLATVARST